MSDTRTYTPACITVVMEPEKKEMILPRPKMVMHLLQKLEIRQGTALVIRDGELLTPDRAILPGDRITLRIVTSSG